MSEKISIERLHELMRADKFCREMGLDLRRVKEFDGEILKAVSNALVKKYGHKIVSNKEIGEMVSLMMDLESKYRELLDDKDKPSAYRTLEQEIQDLWRSRNMEVKQIEVKGLEGNDMQWCITADTKRTPVEMEQMIESYTLTLKVVKVNVPESKPCASYNEGFATPNPDYFDDCLCLGCSFFFICQDLKVKQISIDRMG